MRQNTLRRYSRLRDANFAITRAMIADLENQQQPDGSILIPEVLRKWMGIDKIG